MNDTWGHCSVSRIHASHVWSCGFNAQHHINQTWWYNLWSQCTSGSEVQDHLLLYNKLKDSLDYINDPVSKIKKINKNPTPWIYVFDTQILKLQLGVGKIFLNVSILVHNCNPSTWMAEAERTWQFWAQPGIHHEIQASQSYGKSLSQKKIKFLLWKKIEFTKEKPIINIES